MAKVILDVTLAHGVDKQDFVDSFDAETQADWWNMLEFIPCCICMHVEEDYIETFRQDSRIIAAEERLEAEPANLPSVISTTKNITTSTPTTLNAGHDYMPLQFYVDTDHIYPATPGQKIGKNATRDDFSAISNATHKNRWVGRNVDIVTLEVGPISSTYAGDHDTHPDFGGSDEQPGHGGQAVGTYVYQCTSHSNMIGNIIVSASDGTRNTYTISVTFGGSGLYSLSGTDRGGAVSGTNQDITINAGDTLIFNVNASGHPFQIRVVDFLGGHIQLNDGSVQNNNGVDVGDVVWNTSTGTRFIPMDWTDLEDSSNNQVSSNSGFSSHAMGVLSAAAGTNCGFAKKARLRAAYLTSGDGTVECINAIIAWHNSKPNNPATGVPDPTIMIGEYQYTIHRRHNIPIDYVSQITDPNGTVNRPGASWSGNYTEFVDRGIIPFAVTNPDTNTAEWCVSLPNQSRYTSLIAANDAAWDAGIIFINAAGNNGAVYTKVADQENTSITIDATTPYTKYYQSGSSVTTSTDSTTVWYPFIAYGPHGSVKAIDVAAGYNSEGAPGLDGYSNRGPGIDIVGLGANTWTAYPQQTHSDGYRWGMFSGTSCATPTVVGKAAAELERYYHYNQAWLSPDQMKAVLRANGRAIVEEFETTTWSSVGTAGTYRSNTIQGGLVRIYNGLSSNGGFTFTELVGTTRIRAHFDHQVEFTNQSTAYVGKRSDVAAVRYPRSVINHTPR